MENLFIYLSDIADSTPERYGFNVWFVLQLMLAPIVVACFRPSQTSAIRILFMTLTIVASYLLINLTLHTHRAFQWQEYVLCQEQSMHPYESPDMHEECKHHINIADGASNMFYMILGWIPAMGYLGIWLWIWQRIYAFQFPAPIERVGVYCCKLCAIPVGGIGTMAILSTLARSIGLLS